MFSIPRAIAMPKGAIQTFLGRRKPCRLNSCRAQNLVSAFRLLYLTRFNKLHMVRKIKCPLGSCWLPIGLCFFISLDGLPPAAAQDLPAQINPAQINILVVAGEGASSPVRQRVSQDPTVRIEDDDHQPIAGVAVVFAVPVSGTSGEFTNGAKTLTVVTDKTGVATAHGLKTNEIPGKLQIYVTASFHGLRARTLINQMVEGVPGAPVQVQHTAKSSGKWKWILLGVAAAGGGAAGIYFGTHHSSSSNPPISIGTGTVVFGSPQ